MISAPAPRVGHDAGLGVAVQWDGAARTESLLVVGAAEVNGHCAAFLAYAKPPALRRGHAHPHSKNQSLRNGPKLGETLDCKEPRVFPAPTRLDVHGPPSPAGFG